MGINILRLLASCIQCSAIVYHDETATCETSDGTLLKVVKKISSCSRCYLDYYCGKECQAKHWPIHKKTCKVLNLELERPNARKCALQYKDQILSGNLTLNYDGARLSLYSMRQSKDAVGNIKIEVLFQNQVIVRASFQYCNLDITLDS